MARPKLHVSLKLIPQSPTGSSRADHRYAICIANTDVFKVITDRYWFNSQECRRSTSYQARAHHLACRIGKYQEAGTVRRRCQYGDRRMKLLPVQDAGVGS